MHSHCPSTSKTRPDPTYRVIILGAGRSVRGSGPSAITPVASQGCVLDWILQAYRSLREPAVHFVGGHGAGAVMERYTDIRFLLNPDWDTTGPAASLARAPLESTKATYISYADIVYRPVLVERMESIDCDVVVAVDGNWRKRYDGRSRAECASAEKVTCRGDSLLDIGRHVSTPEATGEFAGVLRLSRAAARVVARETAAGAFEPTDDVPQVIRHLIRSGFNAVACEVNGAWAELDAPQDLARFILGTKAESLERLQPVVRKGCIDKLVVFTHDEWQRNPGAVVERLQGAFRDARVIVRSTAASEDAWSCSLAGKHKSVSSVRAADAEGLRLAVREVIDSYAALQADEQVLVQEMLADVAMSGVLMTRTLTIGAPYYVINYDDTTARTDTVTSGNGRSLRTVYLRRGQPLPARFGNELHGVLEVAKELEALVGHDSLDIEFAVTKDGRVHVLQVRPIAVTYPDRPVDDDRAADGVADARRLFRRLQKAAPGILGRATSLSVMSDWNPAEIIGTKPNRLAFSLYRYLVTDEVWARQRAEYGYRDVRPCNLIVDVLGHPYVDVRVAFNSFIPASLPDGVAGELVDHYLECLTAHAELHDKVEFEIVFTCLTFDFDESCGRLHHAGMEEASVDLLREALRAVTRRGIARCARDAAALGGVNDRFRAEALAMECPLERAYLLLEHARLNGLPLFAHLARAAFVATSLLRSLKQVDVLTDQEIGEFLGSIRTVSSAIREDGAAVAEGRLSWDEYVAKYGHLRPGTYEIGSSCYAGNPEDYLRPMVRRLDRPATGNSEGAAPWSVRTSNRVSDQLERLDLGVDLGGFERFLRTAIEGRELGKFEVTKNLSAALEALAEFGEAHGISREDISHVRIRDLFELRAARTESVSRTLRRLVGAGREASYVTQATCLPSQIFSEFDLVCFEQCRATPNFVTQKRVRALVDVLLPKAGPIQSLSGKIALAPNADPGFDWIFSNDIAGLVTMYGGANSHMAVRAAELNLPAAIGVGETLFNEIGEAKVIELDCGSRQIRPVFQQGNGEPGCTRLFRHA